MTTKSLKKQHLAWFDQALSSDISLVPLCRLESPSRVGKLLEKDTISLNPSPLVTGLVSIQPFNKIRHKPTGYFFNMVRFCISSVKVFSISSSSFTAKWGTTVTQFFYKPLVQCRVPTLTSIPPRLLYYQSA